MITGYLPSGMTKLKSSSRMDLFLFLFLFLYDETDTATVGRHVLAST